MGESTSGPWESTRDLCALAWTRPVDRHLKRARYNMRIWLDSLEQKQHWTITAQFATGVNLCQTCVFFWRIFCMSQSVLNGHLKLIPFLDLFGKKRRGCKKILRCIIVSYSCMFFWVYNIKWSKSWNTNAGNWNDGLLRRWWGNWELERFKAIREVLFAGLWLNVEKILYCLNM